MGMTNEEAEREAKRRWPTRGIVRERLVHDGPVARYMVGVVVSFERNVVTVHGEGATWEAAFQEADSRAEFLKSYGSQIASGKVPVTVPNVIRSENPEHPGSFVPDVHPNDVYEFLTDMATRGGQSHKKGSQLTVIDFTTQFPHHEISASGRNWICETIYGISVWATLESCISRGLFKKVEPQ